MGAYAEFKIDNFSFLWTKNNYYPMLNYFFNNNDFYIERDLNEKAIRYFFRTKNSVLRKTLDIMGYTVKNAKMAFNKNTEEMIDYFIDNDWWFKDDFRRKNYIKRNFTFLKWKNALKTIVQKINESNIFDYRNIDYIPQTFTEKWIIDSFETEESYFGLYPDKFNILFTIRIILEIFNDDELIEYDVTDLIESGYNELKEFQNLDSHKIKKHIVLVEGSTDKTIIEFAFKHIYPQYSKFFYFVDFDNPKRQGSSSEITRIIKAFNNSNMDNTFIAMYDNDTAGNKEITLLKDVKFNNNIKIIKYPDIKFAKRYPTLGTNGKLLYDNINGRACSIELYLPDELLKDETSSLNYIIWKSLDDKLKQYQGEINNKSQIQENFYKLKRKIEKNTCDFILDDWKKLNILIDNIICSVVD